MARAANYVTSYPGLGARIPGNIVRAALLIMVGWGYVTLRNMRQSMHVNMYMYMYMYVRICLYICMQCCMVPTMSFEGTVTMH